MREVAKVSHKRCRRWFQFQGVPKRSSSVDKPHSIQQYVFNWYIFTYLNRKFCVEFRFHAVINAFVVIVVVVCFYVCMNTLIGKPDIFLPRPCWECRWLSHYAAGSAFRPVSPLNGREKNMFIATRQNMTNIYNIWGRQCWPVQCKWPRAWWQALHFQAFPLIFNLN